MIPTKPRQRLLARMLRRACALLGVTVVVTPVLAAEPTTTPAAPQEPLSLSGTVALGGEYNSNLSVAQLESATGQSDVAATFDLALNAGWRPNQRFTVEGGYSYTASRYQDIDSLDLDMHLLFADASYDFGGITLGSNVYYADADLGDHNFLELTQYSLYAGKLFGQSWYARAALNSSDKAFDVFTARDADNDGVSVELYRFFNSGRSNVMVGYGWEDEDTRGASFRYTANSLRARVNHRFSLLQHDARLQVGLRWQDRDYRFITPSIGVPRDDRQRVADARLEFELVENLMLIGRMEHGSYRSRLPSADYSDNRYALQLQLAF